VRLKPPMQKCCLPSVRGLILSGRIARPHARPTSARTLGEIVERLLPTARRQSVHSRTPGGDGYFK
jgi:hypothetical protein